MCNFILAYINVHMPQISAYQKKKLTTSTAVKIAEIPNQT